MVRYDSASRVRRGAALRLHTERGRKAGSRWAFSIFLACFHTAGVHDGSTTDTVDTESPPLIYRPVEAQVKVRFQQKHTQRGPEVRRSACDYQ